MALNVEATIDQAELRKLAAAINYIIEETGRSANDAVTYAGVKICDSGRRVAKPGKKIRKVITNPEAKQANKAFAWARRQKRMGKEISSSAEAALLELDKTVAPYAVVGYRQGNGTKQQRMYLVPVWSKEKNSFRIIEEHGLAKTIWNNMSATCAAMKNNGANANAKQFRVWRYTQRYGDGAGVVALRVVNKLSYMEKAYPGIASTAIQKGSEALFGQMNRNIKEATAKANRGIK